MGANLSLLAPHAQTVAIRSYVDVLPDYQFLEIINNARYLKAIKAYDRKNKALVVIKVFIKPPQTLLDLHAPIEAISRELALLLPHLNILGWKKILETDLAGYLIRNLARTNLYDRLSMAPFLAPAEKLWLVYQLLRILAVLHDECEIVHGDLKTENLLVSGGNWLFLTDFSAHTKPAMLPENNPSEYAFYFDLSNRRTCYVAPERFYSTAQEPSSVLFPEADLFSLGCVILELYNDGEPTFTLSGLFRYKRGEYSVSFLALPDHVANMARACLSLDPKSRPSAKTCLESPAFPGYYGFLHGFLYNLNRLELLDGNRSTSDIRIEHIYAEYGNLVSHLGLSYQNESSAAAFPSFWLGLPAVPKKYRVRVQKSTNDGCLIVLNAVLSLVSTLRQPDSKVKACELILALSEHISDDAKLDRSVPYFCQFFDDFLKEISQVSAAAEPNFLEYCPVSSRVACVALLAVTNLLETCTLVNNFNVHMFSEFLFPKLRAVAYMNSHFSEELDHFKKAVALCFPYLVRISARFDSFSNVEQKSDDVTEITEAFLTAPNVEIRISLVNNLLPLCQYFGVDKTNDVILPHLITYLNDASYQLRLAFLLSLIGIGSFIGVLAFEQYLIPLLLQTLGDHEILVVLKALEIFVFFVQEKLIMAQFNALSIYKELLKLSLPLLLQPNEWIRQSVVCLVLAVSENLLDADRFCFLYPLVKSYLAYDISEISWETLYPCLVKPLSHRVFDLSLTWLSKSTQKSLFWKQKQVSVVKSNGKRKLVSYSKDMGKSVYIGTQSPETSSEFPLSNEDRSWVLKLKSVGMDVKELWKVFYLKDFLLGISRLRSYSETGHQRNFELASTMNIPPKTVFFDVRYKAEPITEKGKEIHTKNTFSGFLPKKATASLQTSEANVFGEIDLPNDPTPHEEKGTTRMFSISNEIIITSTVRHNFGGTNPYIHRYLENVHFEPTLGDFSEFGPIAKSPQDVKGASVQGKLVARLKNNANSNQIEAVTKLAVSPFSEFFISGSETGILRVWDASKVDSLNSKSAKLTLEFGGSITAMVFMPQRFCFAAANSEGKVGIFRVHVVRGKNRKIVKLAKLLPIREFSMAKGYATALEFLEYGEKTVLMAVSTLCHVMGFDVITAKTEFELRSPPEYGVPEALLPTSDWLLVGTKEGILCLWDMRFQLLVNAWRVKTEGDVAAIRGLVLLKNEKSLFAMIGGSDEPDVTMWEIPSFECRQVLSSSSTPQIKKYHLQKLEELSIAELFSGITLDEPSEKRANTCLAAGKDKSRLLTATADKRVVLWDTKDVQKLVLLSGKSTFHLNQVLQDFGVLYEKMESGEVIYDEITALGVLEKGQEMVVVGDRSGYLSIYC